MRRGFAEVFLFCLILTSFIAFSSIDTFSCQQISTSAVSNVTKSGTTSLYNFSVVTTGNFTALNLTIPTAFTYIENSSNSTLYPNWTCSNVTSNVVNCSCLTCNVSVNETTSIYVWFNATSPSGDSETAYNFTAFVWANQTNNATANTTIGNDGNITIISYVNGVTNDTIVQNQNITIIALVQDAFSGINLSLENSVQVLLLDYTTGVVNKTYNMTNTTSSGTNGQNNYSATFDTGILTDGAYNISIYATDQVGNYNYSNTSYYFTVTPQPDLIIESVNWTSVYGDSHPFMSYNGSYTNFTINVSVKNNGTANIVNLTKMIFKWDSYTVTRNLTLLSVGATQNFNYSIVGDSTNVSRGNHAINITLDTLSNQTEKSETNNNYVENIYVGYNVSVLGISPSSVVPGGVINITVKLLYGNGSAVTGLSNKDNFTIFDRWGSGNYIDYGSGKFSLYSSLNASGIYNLSYTVNSSLFSATKVAQYGVHDIRVGVENGNYSGWINSTDNDYVITAPNLDIRFYGVDTTLTKNTQEDAFQIKYENTGNAAISNITLRIQTNSSNIKIATTAGGTYSQTYTCNVYWGSGQSLSSANGEQACSTIYLKGTSTGTYKLYYIYAFGAATTDGTKYNSTSLPYNTITVADPPADEDDSSSSSTNTYTPTTTTTYECTLDSNCSSNEFCNSSKKCQKRTCSSDQLISNHKCVTININTIYNSTYNIKQGSSITIPFYLNSTRYKVTSVYLKATKPADFNGTISITPSSHTLIKNTLKQYNITFTMPANAHFKKEYIISLAVKKGTTKTFATANITLVASGGNATKIEISESINAYGENLKKYLDDLEKIKSKLDDEDQSSIDARTSKVNRLIEEISGLIENEEYLRADEKITELNTEMQNLNNSINELTEKTKKKQRNFRIFLFVIFIFAGIGALTYYMLLPDEAGYIPNKGFVKKGKKQETKETLLEMIEEAKDEMKKIFNKKKDKNPLKKRAYNYKKTVLKRAVR
ncbi:MAG: hypothetical protein KAR87_03145 [Candidatus Aenigmarchaeota archaeon]|nr:hypothetical protein [Candidatus Aenigmarchaeota archaeon]